MGKKGQLQRPSPFKLYLCGGRDHQGHALQSVQRFTQQFGDPRTNPLTGEVSNGRYKCWESMKPLRGPRWGAATAMSEDAHKILVFGGCSGESLLGTVEQLDTSTGEWQPLPSMPQFRSQAAAASARDYFYVGGGVGIPGELSSVLRYDPMTQEWSLLPPMTHGRVDHAMAVVGPQLFAMGGSRLGDSLNTIECLSLDPGALAEGEDHCWNPLPPMSQPRRGVAALVVRNSIWVFGGHTGIDCLRSVESYDPRAREWVTKPPMQEPRFGASAFFFENLVCVGGGHNGVVSLTSVESFNSQSARWNSFLEFPDVRSVTAVGVLHDYTSQDEAVARGLVKKDGS